MYVWIRRFLQSDPPPIAPQIEDPILGVLVWSADDEAWLSTAKEGDGEFRFQIAGTPEPDRALLAHAADIARRRAAFTAEVLAFVRSEIERVRGLRSYREELLGLRIERVCLFWPKRPADAMITFEGGWDYRLWRCDYLARQPRGLCYDS